MSDNLARMYNTWCFMGLWPPGHHALQLSGSQDFFSVEKTR